MELTEIIAELEYYTGKFPEVALENAIEQQQAVTPVLLETLEKCKYNQQELLEEPDYFLHLYALFLLAQFRESRAYSPIIEFFSFPGELPMKVTGDVVTEDLGRILASVSHGNLDPIKSLVENQQVNEFIRGAGLDSLITLFAEGIISRETVIGYFQELFSSKLTKESFFLWNSLVYNSMELYPLELQESIQQAFELELVEPFFINQKEIDSCLEQGKDATLEELRNDPHYRFIEDTIKEMKGWGCFQNEDATRNKKAFGFEHLKLSSSSKSKSSQKQSKKKQKKSRQKNRSKKK